MHMRKHPDDTQPQLVPAIEMFPVKSQDIMNQRQEARPVGTLPEFLTYGIHEHNKIFILLYHQVWFDLSCNAW